MNGEGKVEHEVEKSNTVDGKQLVVGFGGGGGLWWFLVVVVVVSCFWCCENMAEFLFYGVLLFHLGWVILDIVVACYLFVHNLLTLFHDAPFALLLL